MIKKNHKQVGLKIFSESRMFGASIVRAKRERERKERLARGEDPPIIPYIKPFGPRFDASQLPYFKYRQAVATLGQVGIVLDINSPILICQQSLSSSVSDSRLNSMCLLLIVSSVSSY